MNTKKHFGIKVRLSKEELDQLVDKLNTIDNCKYVNRIYQKNMYFKCRDINDKMKIRTEYNIKWDIGAYVNQLICYKRNNKKDVELDSCYIIDLGKEETSWKCYFKVLQFTNGYIDIVRKTRDLYMIGNTRVYVDDIDDLGFFVELVLVEGKEEEKVIAIMKKLDININNFVNHSYIDLLLIQKHLNKF